MHLRENACMLQYFICSVQIGSGCVLGRSVSLAPGVVLKKSIIGKHVKLGENVRIINSIIMDHTTIESRSVPHSVWPGVRCWPSSCVVRCQIQDSIICNNVIIEANCSVQSSRLGGRYKLVARCEDVR